MYCCSCGKELQSAFVFCPSCGTRKGGTRKGGTRKGGTRKGGTRKGGTRKGGTRKGGTRKGGTRKGGTRKGGTRKGGTRKGGTRKGGTRKGGTSDIISPSNTETDSANADSSKRKWQSASTNPPSFSAYMKQKETERQSHFKPNKKKGRVGETQAKDEVIINVGLMEYEYGEAKIQRGKSFPVKLSKDMGYDGVRERALKKWEDYDRTFSRDRGYVITFQDGKLAKQIPGSSEEFTLRKYKEGLGKSYSRIVLYLCPATKKRTESTMPITNWLSEEAAEIERVLWDSDSNVDDFTDDFIDSSTEASATPVPAPSPHQPEVIQLFEVADFL